MMLDPETLRSLYRKYMLEFPEDERPDEDSFVEYYTTDKNVTSHRLECGDSHLLLWCDLPCGVKVIEFFVIDKGHRNNGLGTQVFKEWMDRQGGSTPKVVCEVDSEAGLRFWARFGIVPVENYCYIQPALHPGGMVVTDLMLSTNFHSSREYLNDMVREWYRYGFGLEGDYPRMGRLR